MKNIIKIIFIILIYSSTFLAILAINFHWRDSISISLILGIFTASIIDIYAELVKIRNKLNEKDN